MLLNTTRIDKAPRNTKISQSQLISLYVDPPQEEITLDEFEMFALDR
jgi:hypothetical protein